MTTLRFVSATMLALCGVASTVHAKSPSISAQDFAVDANASQPNAVKDPFEQINRRIFAFNDYLDRKLLLPTAKVYQAMVPAPINTGIGHFFLNLNEPWSAVNHLLQGHVQDSARSFGRFGINTITTLGFADPAFYVLNLKRMKEDFGQTLGVWGVKSGPFLMLPILGPSTLRDGVGRIVDGAGTPQSYIETEGVYPSLIALEVVDLRADLIGVESLVKGDQYSLLRDVYLQQRVFQIQNSEGRPVAPAIDDSFGDEGAFAQDSNAPTDPAPSAAAPTDQPPPSAQPPSTDTGSF